MRMDGKNREGMVKEGNGENKEVKKWKERNTEGEKNMGSGY